MGLSDYFGRFWFAAEPVFGIVMTLCFLAILRNQALYAYPLLLERATVLVIGAAISCCIAWGIVDGIFYAWENHHLTARKNLAANYAKNEKQREKSLKMVEEDLQDTYVDLLTDDEKNNLYEKVIANLSQSNIERKIANQRRHNNYHFRYGPKLGCLSSHYFSTNTAAECTGNLSVGQFGGCNSDCFDVLHWCLD